MTGVKAVFVCFVCVFRERPQLVVLHIQCIYWLILECALTWDPTHILGVSGRRSNQLSYPARPNAGLFQEPRLGPDPMAAGFPWEQLPRPPHRHCLPLPEDLTHFLHCCPPASVAHPALL